MNLDVNRILEEKTLKEIEELNKKYLYEENGRTHCRDEEGYHAEFDGIITTFLKRLNYKEVARLYDEAEEFFWYA